jgi:mono/diheme cytochrome c family protein
MILASVTFMAAKGCGDAPRESNSNGPTGVLVDEFRNSAPPQQTDGPTPINNATSEVAVGLQLFLNKANCYTCHGEDARGTPLAPDLTDGQWIHVNDSVSIADVIRYGVLNPKEYPAPMPAMGGASLTADEVNQVAAYVSSLGGGR